MMSSSQYYYTLSNFTAYSSFHHGNIKLLCFSIFLFCHVGANSTITSSGEKLYFAAISVRILLIKFMSFTNKTSFLGIPEDSISPSYIKLFLTTLSEKYLLLDKYRFTSFPEILVLYFANSLDLLLSRQPFYRHPPPCHVQLSVALFALECHICCIISNNDICRYCIVKPAYGFILYNLTSGNILEFISIFKCPNDFKFFWIIFL